MKRVSREPSKWKNVGRYILDTLMKIEEAEDFKIRARRLHGSFCKLVNFSFPSDVSTPLRTGLSLYFQKVGELAGLGTVPRKSSK